MQKISNVQAVQNAQTVRPLSEINERECLAKLAGEVPEGGRILEIGCLYGGMTGVLALANPRAQVTSVDDFSWHPEDDVQSSAELVMKNMAALGASNVSIIEGSSLKVGADWDDLIDLLWVDGGHEYEIASADLRNFGPHAKVIAIHDYGNPWLKGVKRAADDFLEQHPEFQLTEVVHWVAVMRRK